MPRILENLGKLKALFAMGLLYELETVCVDLRKYSIKNIFNTRTLCAHRVQEYHLNHSVYKLTYMCRGYLKEPNVPTPRVETTLDMNISNKKKCSIQIFSRPLSVRIIYHENPCFLHGQFFVTGSLVEKPSALFVCAPENKIKKKAMYHEVVSMMLRQTIPNKAFVYFDCLPDRRSCNRN